jgi:hypothetical protein
VLEPTTEQGALLALLRSLNARLSAIVDYDVEAVMRGPAKTSAERRRLIEEMEDIIGQLEAMNA